MLSESRERALFVWYVKPALHALQTQYDDKYWPTTEQVMRAVSAYASEAGIAGADPITAAALSSRQHSNADFFRALFVCIDNLAHAQHVPDDFDLSDKALAIVASCALDLSGDVLTEETVKGYRQKMRESGKGYLLARRKSRE